MATRAVQQTSGRRRLVPGVGVFLSGLVLISALFGGWKILSERRAQELFDTGETDFFNGDYQGARDAWGKAAALGYARANLRLGDSRLDGFGVVSAPSEAVPYYRLACDAGENVACARLGELFERGLGVPRDDEAAAALYRVAASEGIADAQAGLGVLLFNGRGIRQDVQEAVRWLRMAAEQGSARAAITLGLAHLRGEGVAESATEAAKWYRRAAEAGSAEGAFRLSLLLYTGDSGVAARPVEAMAWLERAAEQGHVDAKSTLGVRLLAGDSTTPRDIAAARRWLGEAAAAGDGLAQRLLPNAREMTPVVPTSRAEAESAAPASRSDPDEIGQCDLEDKNSFTSRGACEVAGGRFVGSRADQAGSLVEIRGRYVPSATSRAASSSGGGAGLTERDLATVTRQLGGRPIDSMPSRAGVEDRNDQGVHGGRDWVVCYSENRRDDLPGTRQSGMGATRGARVKCSRALPKTTSLSSDECARRGFDGTKLFKFESSASEWIQASCWTAWREKLD